MTMRCETCDNGDRQPARRPYVQQRGDRVAVVTEVPVDECAACGEVWFAEDVALRLDELLTEMLTTELVAVRPYSAPASTAA
jgi:YgiT-type zinc finger domain-containing protein